MAPKCGPESAQAGSNRATKKDVAAAVTKQTKASGRRARPACKSQGSSATQDLSREALLSKIADHHKCPISKQLLVDPVMAEDGHIYERKAILQWFLKKKVSPATNRPIGDKVVSAVAARQTVAELVEQGVVDAEASLSFFLERGRERAARVETSNGLAMDLEGAEADFRKALELAVAPAQRTAAEFQLKAVAWMREGAKLAAEVKSMQRDGGSIEQEIRDWMPGLGSAARAVLTSPFSPQETRLAEWANLRQGTRVRVLGDLAELKRLCERPPAGASEAVKWNDDMEAWVGTVCTVQRRGDSNHKNYALIREGESAGRTFYFPFDSLFLIARSS